jgi:hypothetical protein
MRGTFHIHVIPRDVTRNPIYEAPLYAASLFIARATRTHKHRTSSKTYIITKHALGKRANILRLGILQAMKS